LLHANLLLLLLLLRRLLSSLVRLSTLLLHAVLQLLRKLVVHSVVGAILVRLLQVLDLGLPGSTRGLRGVFDHGGPSGFCAEKLYVARFGGEGGAAGDAEDVGADAVAVAVAIVTTTTDEVGGDEGSGVED
jgi:hypothetical protein